ncbi:MAG: GNAT family N-acetyltransferase [Pseudomonadota bacterium]
MTDVSIRRATPADTTVLARFNTLMALETEHKRLDEPVVTAGVRRLLETPDLGFYLVAEHEQVITGALAITFEWSDWRNGLFWWIQSVYVMPAFRQQGVFRTLYNEVNRQARSAENVCGIRLYVEKDNLNAQQTYLRLGMAETDYRLYEVEFSH